MNDVLLTDRRLTVLRALDKLDRLGAVGVFLLLTCGRMDKSGDFCEGGWFVGSFGGISIAVL